MPGTPGAPHPARGTRHAARGTLAEFIGPGENDANLKMDIDTRREGYTDEEVQKMFDDFDDKFGAIGVKIQEGLQAYADGINAYIAELRMDPSRCPAEYQALGNPCPEPEPADWTPTDTLFVAILQLPLSSEPSHIANEQAAHGKHARPVIQVRLKGARPVPGLDLPLPDLHFFLDRHDALSLAALRATPAAFAFAAARASP